MRVESRKEIRIFGILVYNIIKIISVEGAHNDVSVTEFNQDKLWDFLRKIEKELTRVYSKI